jgi:hypothetical protein
MNDTFEVVGRDIWIFNPVTPMLLVATSLIYNCIWLCFDLDESKTDLNVV